MSKAVVFHVIVDYISISSFDTTSSEGDKIFVFDVAECGDFSNELSLASHRFKLNWKHFYSHERAISEPALQSQTKQPDRWGSGLKVLCSVNLLMWRKGDQLTL